MPMQKPLPIMPRPVGMERFAASFVRCYTRRHVPVAQLDRAAVS
jgi:hypothetical protein